MPQARRCPLQVGSGPSGASAILLTAFHSSWRARAGGTVEDHADLPEGATRDAVQAEAKLGNQPLPGRVQALHGRGEGIGEYRRARPSAVDPCLRNPNPLAVAGSRLPRGKAVRAGVAGR
jgi:hypothetical protein